MSRDILLNFANLSQLVMFKSNWVTGFKSGGWLGKCETGNRNFFINVLSILVILINDFYSCSSQNKQSHIAAAILKV